MKQSARISSNFAIIGTMLCACAISARAGTVSMQIIADNDFAMFVGTDNSITRLIYQNDVSWPDQLSNLANFSISLQGNETTFYLLGLGGGGDENVSGTVNNVDLTTIDVLMSSDVGPFLTGFEAQANGGTVADGTYNASLADVQAALPDLTWGSPTLANGDFVVSQSPTGRGFHFDPSTAHLFQFAASAVNVPNGAPEPSTWVLFLGGGVAIALGRFRRSSPPRA